MKERGTNIVYIMLALLVMFIMLGCSSAPVPRSARAAPDNKLLLCSKAGSIYSLNENGTGLIQLRGGESKLTKDTTESIINRATWFSPDRRTILFLQSIATWSKKGGGSGLLDEKFSFWLMDADGNHARKLTDIPVAAKSVLQTDYLQWAPDGKKIYLAYDGFQSINMGGHWQKIENDVWWLSTPASLGPDGRTMAYVDHSLKMAQPSLELARLTPNKITDNRPVYSDQTDITQLEQEDGWISWLDEGRIVAKVTTNTVFRAQPGIRDWLWDSRKPTSSDLAILEIDDKTLKKFYSFSEYPASLCLSPDARSIAFLENYRLPVILDIASGTTKPLQMPPRSRQWLTITDVSW